MQHLRGELKRTEIRGNTRYQLTTKEFILQRDRRTYRIALTDILGVVECSEEEVRKHDWYSPWYGTASFGVPYKIVTTLMHLVSPSGVIEQQGVSFYARLSEPFARHLAALLAESG